MFDRFTASAFAGRQTEIAEYWKTCLRVISWVLLPIILASGVAWFVVVAMTMSGQPLQIDILKIVWTQTQFGTVSKIRLVFLLAAAVLSWFLRSPPAVREFAAWVQTVAAGCLLGSLAWAGHGQETSRWHLLADVLHLLAAGIWPAGLAPLFLLLRRARKVSGREDWQSMAMVVSRFSAVSLATVLLLALTGTVNAWFLVGSFSDLVTDPYGRWLLAKIILFCMALAIASVNLLRLKPRLLIEHSQPEKAKATVAQLQTNVQFELALGSGIIAVVAVLGILPPAIH
ncbi:MAG TPA: CopD family protein [Candidatus Sulfotelmatobacter sp.]|nr:CopD family protein [Candidatus Sulfotelmatobacter sp.]